MSFAREVRHDPVLIIGMHRSGTTMLARMLDELGLFMGWRVQGDHEATFFLGLNDWLLEQCRCGWDNPGPLQWLLDDPPMRAAALEYLDFSLRSPRMVEYLGPAKYLRARAPERLDGPWGFKDPRSTFTLPLWLEFYPNARLIHVQRHGVDVAASLGARHARIVEQRRARFRRMRWLYRVRSRRSRITTSVRAASLETGFSLWEEYMDGARLALERHAGPCLEIRYEEFLADPATGLRRAAKFCELPASDEAVQATAGEARPERAFAHRRKEALLRFAEQRADRLAVRGY